MVRPVRRVPAGLSHHSPLQSLAKGSRVGGLRHFASPHELEASLSESVNLSNLEKLAKALGCDPGYLIVKKGK